MLKDQVAHQGWDKWEIVLQSVRRRREGLWYIIVIRILSRQIMIRPLFVLKTGQEVSECHWYPLDSGPELFRFLIHGFHHNFNVTSLFLQVRDICLRYRDMINFVSWWSWPRDAYPLPCVECWVIGESTQYRRFSLCHIIREEFLRIDGRIHLIKREASHDLREDCQERVQ